MNGLVQHSHIFSKISLKLCRKSKKNEFRRNYRTFLNDGFVCKQLFDNCLRTNPVNGKRKEKKVKYGYNLYLFLIKNVFTHFSINKMFFFTNYTPQHRPHRGVAGLGDKMY